MVAAYRKRLTGDDAAERMEAVSYTHLDVYKRQPEVSEIDMFAKAGIAAE